MTQIEGTKPLTISQLTQAIKQNLESTFSFVFLQGEVINFKEQTSGHLYFSLKDTHSQILAVMFKSDASLLRMLPKTGDHVVVKGELNVYPPKGNYQVIVRELSYVGLGELLLRLEELKIKLHQLGWFKKSRKKPLPHLPKKIGVVTSPTGAVIQDILNVLTRRFSGFHLILNPVKVQGEGAAQEIAQAIQEFNKYNLVDVIIVGRGGGSLEDLWAFNEEIVADAIYHSRIPIISAVGHETDHCIADYVADVRAPTPSAAAEIVIAEKKQLLEGLAQSKKRLHNTLLHLIHKNSYRLEGLKRHPFIQNPLAHIEFRMQNVDGIQQDLAQSIKHKMQWLRHRLDAISKQTEAHKPSNQIRYYRQRLVDLQSRIGHSWRNRIHQKMNTIKTATQRLHHLWEKMLSQRQRTFHPEKLYQQLDRLILQSYSAKHQKLNYFSSILKSIDPKNLLKKGYSILFAEKGPNVIHSIEELEVGQQAKILLTDGEALITINQLISHERRP